MTDVNSWRTSISNFNTGAKPSTLKFSSFNSCNYNTKETGKNNTLDVFHGSISIFQVVTSSFSRFNASKTNVSWLPRTKKSHFVTQKTSYCFSMIAYDHGNEQLNAVLKEDVGIIGITKNESTFKQWLIAG